MTICKTCYGTSSTCTACQGRGITSTDITLAAVQALIKAAVEPLDREVELLRMAIKSLQKELFTLRTSPPHASASAYPNGPSVANGISAFTVAGTGGGRPNLTDRAGKYPSPNIGPHTMGEWYTETGGSAGAEIVRRAVRKYLYTNALGADVTFDACLGGWMARLILADGDYYYGAFATAGDAMRHADLVIHTTGH